MRVIAVALLIAIVGCSGGGGSRSARSDSVDVGAPVAHETVSPDSTSSVAAVAWIQDYYKAINEHRYRDAYAHWAGGGQASGKSFGEFLKGFEQTGRVEVIVGAPGPIGAAAGSRYVEVPVRIEARTRAGAGQSYSGSYTLRLSVVDGATPEQRSWHIYSAAVRSVN